MKQTVVVGGGLAGLAFAEPHRESPLVLEAAGVPGGLCASYREGGFTFDYTGHLWHFKDDNLRAQVEDWLDGPLQEHQRNAGVWFAGRIVPYPFQTALYHLPDAVAKDIVLGAQRARLAGVPAGADHLDAAARQRLGDGVVDHFLKPYYGKLLGADLREVLAGPMLRFLPLPDHAAILKSYLEPAKFGGYNAEFFYPRGGNGRVIDALARQVKNLRVNARVTVIDPRTHTVVVDGSEPVNYEHLVVTAPLDAVARMTAGAPPSDALRAAGIMALNLGVKGAAPYLQHWVYYPGAEQPFYRVGCYTNFAPELAPENHYSLYVEIPLAWWNVAPPAEREGLVLAELVRVGWLRAMDDVVVRSARVIDPAYVVPTAAGEAQRRELLAWFADRDITLLGRYAEWDYLGMDDVLAHVMACRG